MLLTLSSIALWLIAQEKPVRSPATPSGQPVFFNPRHQHSPASLWAFVSCIEIVPSTTTMDLPIFSIEEMGSRLRQLGIHEL
jgi:hypothetical protein